MAYADNFNQPGKPIIDYRRASLVIPCNPDGSPTSIDGGSGGGGAASVQRTPALASVNSDGVVAAGAKKLTFNFSTDFEGTVLGVGITGEGFTSLTIPCPDNDTLAAVGYTVTAGTILILTVR